MRVSEFQFNADTFIMYHSNSNFFELCLKQLNLFLLIKKAHQEQKVIPEPLFISDKKSKKV